MSDYKDEHDRFYRDLDDLGKIREAAAKERRLKELAVRLGKSQSVLLKQREAFILKAVDQLGISRVAAEAILDVAIGLEPPN